jgi:hypothetical protein
LVFFGHKLVGDSISFQHHLANRYDLELTAAAADWEDAAERRRSDFMNTSPRSFVKVALQETEHAAFGSHLLTLEIFSDELPLSAARFLRLCKGRHEDPANPGYLGSECSRVQKGDFLQFGKLACSPQSLATLDDEAFIHSHEEPGMVGFVG